jgi:hypothetical protein
MSKPRRQTINHAAALSRQPRRLCAKCEATGAMYAQRIS